MLESKIKLKKAMEKKEPKKRVKALFIEYVEAYHRLHKPSEHHVQNYKDMFLSYLEYMNRSDIKDGGKFW